VLAVFAPRLLQSYQQIVFEERNQEEELKIIALKKIEILLPPITLQNLFAERIQLIEAQKQQAQASLQKAEELFNSLLQRAFNGELM